MNKLMILVFVSLTLFVVSCQNKASNSDNEIQPQIDNEKTRTFKIEAKQWEFNPSTINVNEGDNVILEITSLDVTHGFTISGYNINKVLKPGQTETIQFKADQKGTFGFVCSVPCGKGHSDMKGSLIVS